MSGDERNGITRGGTKAAFILNAISLAFIVLEAMMGPTILGNIIFLGLAIILALIGALAGATALISRRTKAAAGVLVMSALLISYVVVRFYLDTVPAGYGP